MAVMEPDRLDLALGIQIQAEIRAKFGVGVNYQRELGLSEFFLVVSVGRCAFRLCADTIARMLQASLGGKHDLFIVVRLGDRVFRFSVASKQVGFYILNLKSYECPLFKIFFHRFGNGWPHVQREFNQWSQEEDSEWTLVQHKRKPYRRFMLRLLQQIPNQFSRVPTQFQLRLSMLKFL